MNLTWKIEWVKTTPSTAEPPRFVVECGWRCTAVDGDFAGTVYGTCSFQQLANADGTFAPYADLTEEQVLGWCWESGVDKEACEATVKRQLETQMNPPVVQQPLPWSV